MSQTAVSPVTGPGRTRCHAARAPAARLAAQRAGRATCAAAPQDFLAVATPGAGKTTFALRVAAELLADRTIDAITVVTPTEHLKTQWARPRRGVGIALDPDFRNSTGATSSDFHGIAVTYAQVAAHPVLHRGAHRDPAHAGDPRRGAPRRRRAVVGRGGARGVRARGAPADADRHAVPPRRQPDPVRRLRAGRRRACCAAAPTTPTATPRRWPTASCGRWSSWPTPASRAGGPAPARS